MQRDPLPAQEDPTDATSPAPLELLPPRTSLSRSVLAVSLLSKRSLPAILFSYFALDEASAYFRLLIWEFGSQSVMNHPIFGVGMGQWDRPSWMPFSIDMFWLVNAVVGGLPAALFITTAFFSNTLSAALKGGLDERAHRCRLAFVVTMTSFFLAGWMVHFWGATYVLFMLLMGSARWAADQPEVIKPRNAARRASAGDRQAVKGRSRPAKAVADISQ